MKDNEKRENKCKLRRIILEDSDEKLKLPVIIPIEKMEGITE